MGRAMTPATCRFFVSMKPGDRARGITLTPAWQKNVQRINTKTGYRYLQATNGGWVNTPQWPVVQQLGFENELFEGEYVNKKWVMVYTNKMSRPNEIKPYTIQKWWNIKRDGTFLPGKTFKDQSNIILISYNGYMFVPSNRVIEIA